MNDSFDQFRIIIYVIQKLLSHAHATVFLIKMKKFRNKLRWHTFHAGNILKIAWYETINMPTSLAKFSCGNSRIYQKIVFTISTSSFVVNVLGVVLGIFAVILQELVPLVNIFFVEYATFPYATANISVFWGLPIFSFTFYATFVENSLLIFL